MLNVTYLVVTSGRDMDLALPARKRNRVTLLLLVSLMVVPFLASAQNVLTAQQWREDLHYLADQISKTHPGAFHQITLLPPDDRLVDDYPRLTA